MGIKRAIVMGAGGFIGHHLVNRLKALGYFVRAVDLKQPEFSATQADEFIISDLRNPAHTESLIEASFGEIYQLAADMGGAGYIFTGDSDADIMHNSAMINLNVLHAAAKKKIRKVFYSSSACIYPEYNQRDPNNPKCAENTAYPAAPDSEYGWEKLFSERLYASFCRNHGIDVKVARFHNVYGPQGTWTGGKEKAPAALCRKVAETPDGGIIDIWGDGEQTRSFLYIDDCLDGVQALMSSEHHGPFNIGSEERVTINQLAGLIMEIAGKKLRLNHIPGPLGVRGRSSDNALVHQAIGWEPKYSLLQGLTPTYHWIAQQVAAARS
jgi:nucleoside-diphosphate-sugar epimerase